MRAFHSAPSLAQRCTLLNVLPPLSFTLCLQFAMNSSVHNRMHGQTCSPEMAVLVRFCPQIPRFRRTLLPTPSTVTLSPGLLSPESRPSCQQSARYLVGGSLHGGHLSSPLVELATIVINSFPLGCGAVETQQSASTQFSKAAWKPHSFDKMPPSAIMSPITPSSSVEVEWSPLFSLPTCMIANAPISFPTR